MTTGYEIEMYHNISQIAGHLNRIANCLEAAEKRAREQAPYVALSTIEETCSTEGCLQPVVVNVNGVSYCQQHMADTFQEIGDAIRRGTEGLEQAVKEGK